MREDTPIIALVGNPNVGKSTVFNALTGNRQHTGNWAGKTVTGAQGVCRRGDVWLTLVDLPGTYSLRARSEEERITRDFLQNGKADVTIVVADATCLERNLILLLQVLELTPHVVLCLNLMDEAKKKQIYVDVEALRRELGIPVIPCAARRGIGLSELMQAVGCAIPHHQSDSPSKGEWNDPPSPVARIRYPVALEQATQKTGLPRAQALAFLIQHPPVSLTAEQVDDQITAAAALRAEEIALTCITQDDNSNQRDRRIDRLVLSRWFGIPLMLLLLAGIFYLTLFGSNIPSEWLGDHLLGLTEPLARLLASLGVPPFVVSLLTDGLWRVTATVVSVMLPPMAIFFPLFTLLEDAGYLPRIAFQLDHAFQKAHACGKQSLSMCMGLGCNACGVTGCRIIDSPRERLIAMLTNAFAPCNGRFPFLLFLCSVFFAGSATVGAFLLTFVLLFSVALTLLASRLLSATLLKGTPSSFTLELPPYRTPQFGQVIIRSIFDRTLFVLGRAVVVAAPAGMLIWLLANLTIGDLSLLQHIAVAFDPLGRLMGLDGVILLAFLLGFPANELVMPLIVMGYLATGTLTDVGSLSAFRDLLLANGWTNVTAICAIVFTVAHYPCSTTCLTIWKESHSVKWTLTAVALPTLFGFTLCCLIASIASIVPSIGL